ncbi:MAG TPA: PilZ domain-containing protein [Syntrophales bacterium]|nr:PilZ domain-containing protein [Syntrophales bacterium]HPQ44571.1 PilZ domain-containing protein [Syntrophales bacterium]
MEKVRIISRLYTLINSLSEEQRISLLKELSRNELPKYIFKLIIDMPDDQHQIMIDQLEAMIAEERLWDEGQIKVLNIDSRRGSRKSCFILVDLSADDRSSQEVMRDISINGAFIQTGQSLEIGKRIILSFSVPDFEKSFEMIGEVVRYNSEGIGVKFVNLSEKQQDIMKQFIESMGKS